MTTIKEIRQAMLEDTLWPLIEAEFISGAGKVEFFDNSGNPLCEVEFKDKYMAPSGTDKAIMRLVSIDDSHTLKGTVHSPGIVTTFKISGQDPGGVKKDILIGTVGTLTSSAELKFNIVNWIAGTFISIENFDIIIPNGL